MITRVIHGSSQYFSQKGWVQDSKDAFKYDSLQDAQLIIDTVGLYNAFPERVGRLTRNPIRNRRNQKLGVLVHRPKPAKRANPKATKIYENVLRVEAQKGPGHRCDPACKKANHCYYHNFKRPYPSMYGLADKSILIRSK